MANNDIKNHAVCGDASVLVPAQFKEQFGRHHNVKAPLLLCDLDIFTATLRDMTSALPEADWQYAMKTNDHPDLVAIALLEGHGLDCSSVGEILVVDKVVKALDLDHAATMARCSYGNPNKTTSDIAQAYALGVRMFSVDCKKEVDKIAAVANGARVYIRTYVDATQKTAISVFTSKFGASPSTIPDLAVYAQAKGLVPYAVGLSVGGGQTDPDAFALGMQIVGDIYTRCRDAGVASMTGITYCGGLPAQSAPKAPSFATIGARIRAACEQYGFDPSDVTFEPGRGVATDCGIIEAKVITLKEPEDEGDPWTLVLNIGIFKGLFEMDRTNLTYKLAAYGHWSGEDDLVLCRIVDDTCDSKGVCFKEQSVMMPRWLAEGSRVYFLKAGAYTTAYVMEAFNRTLGLVSKCFPNPLAKLANLPDWLQGVPTPGEAAHAGKDFSALWQAYSALHTNAERRQFLIDNVPGAGALGIRLLPAHATKRFRELNSAMVRHNADQPGDLHRKGFQPQQLYGNMWEGWIANSSELTAKAWKGYSNIVAKGGATVYLAIQNQYRSTARHCTLMHGTLVSHPADKADGKKQFVEVNYNPYTVAGLNGDVLDDTFRNALRSEQVYRDPEGVFEQLMVGETLEGRFVPDLIWGGSLDERKPLSDYWPRATAKDGKTRPIHLEGILGFHLNAKQHALFLQLMAFLESSYLAGYGVSNRFHVDDDSCFRTTIRMLSLVMLGSDRHLGENWTTDRMIEHVAKLAPIRMWTDKPGHSIRDIEAFKKAAQTVEVEEFMANVQSILCHPTMMRAHGGDNAYNTDYMTELGVPHRDYHAQQLYREAAKHALAVLERDAEEIGAI